jgi:hypothetical protein
LLSSASWPTEFECKQMQLCMKVAANLATVTSPAHGGQLRLQHRDWASDLRNRARKQSSKPENNRIISGGWLPPSKQSAVAGSSSLRGWCTQSPCDAVRPYPNMQKNRSDPPSASSRQPASGLSNPMTMCDKINLIKSSSPLQDCACDQHRTCERAFINRAFCSAHVRTCECCDGKHADLVAPSTFLACMQSPCCGHLENHPAFPANVRGTCRVTSGGKHVDHASSRAGGTCQTFCCWQRCPASHSTAQGSFECRLCQRRVDVEVGPPAFSAHKAACGMCPNACSGPAILAKSCPWPGCSHGCAAATSCLGCAVSTNRRCVASFNMMACPCPASCSLFSTSRPCSARVLSDAPCGSQWSGCCLLREDATTHD